MQRDSASRAEFVTFQLSEIERVAPKPGEDDELANTRQVLANADKLQRLCAEAYQALYEGDHAALSALGVVWRKVGELAAIDDRFATHVAARETVKPILEDLSFFLRSYAADIDSSPARLQEVEDRLAALERLKKKHGPSLADVIAKAQALQQELDLTQNGAERSAELDTRLATARAQYLERGERLTSKRRAAAPVFCKLLEKSLGELAMARTRCEVRFVPAASETGWTDRGIEHG